MYIIDIDVFTTLERGASIGTIISLILFGPASIGFTYCMTFLFDSASACNFVIICTNFFIGLAGPIISYVLRIFAARDANMRILDAANILDWCLRLIPSFCLGRSLFFSINVDVFELIEGKKLSVWSPPIMLYDIIFLAFESVGYIGIAILLDQWSKDSIWTKRFNKLRVFLSFQRFTNTREYAYENRNIANDMDEDVAAERERILSHDIDSYSIVLDRLTKVYANGKLAVNEMCLGINLGEVSFSSFYKI